ncbi:unnamed protein product [Trifolium pratense]|uniref:Uncharacterized protein n=1 Tax=Trifolium pratense TaxID=57577 RepID=A0ACB0LCZ1_TRIPR|nr:unnamed protein product [Trifolium pratense]
MAYAYSSTPYFQSSSPNPFTSPESVSESTKDSLQSITLLFQKMIETLKQWKEELIADNDEESLDDDEDLLVPDSIDDVQLTPFDGHSDEVSGSVSTVTETLIDNNLPLGFPISDEHDPYLDSETVVSAPHDYTSQFERFTFTTIVRLQPPMTVNPNSSSPPQYFVPSYDPGGQLDTSMTTSFGSKVLQP